MSDPKHPDHPDHRLYPGSRDAVHRLDASLGRAPDEHSDNMIASLASLDRENGLERIDHVVLSGDRKSTRLNSSHQCASCMPSSAEKKKVVIKKNISNYRN